MATRALLRMKKQIFTSVESPIWSSNGFSAVENGHVGETNVSRFYGTHPSASSNIDRNDDGNSSVVSKQQLLGYSAIGRRMNNVIPTLGRGIGSTCVTSLFGARHGALKTRYATSTADQFVQQQEQANKVKEPQAQELGKGKTSDEVKQGSSFFGGSGAASIQPNLVNSLRPLSPHLPVYKPQLTSTVSIFNRISGMYLTAAVLVFYLLCLKAGSICLTYYSFYQFLFYSSSLIPISLELSALAIAYHLYHGAHHSLRRWK